MTSVSVGIIIPLLDEEKNIYKIMDTLASLSADEIIFVDGGSMDETQTLLEKAGVQWVRSKCGRAIQMNVGAFKSKSDILLFLHVDTEISSSHIENIERVMSDPNVVGGRFDVRLSGHHPAFRVIEWFINRRSRLSGISTGDQAMFVRRDVFERLGGFPGQPLMEDVEFSRRLKKEGRIACLHQKVMTSSRRWEKHGIARTVLLMWWLRFRYWLGTDPATLKRLYMDCP